MAKKKKENALTYLQMPLPEGGKYSKMTKVTFGGINKRYTMDSGALTQESNISTNDYPYLTPSELQISLSDKYTNPISLFGFDDFLIVVYRQNGAIKIDYITEDNKVYTGILKSSGATNDDDVPRSIVQFNKYDESIDIVNGNYVKKLLIFPDKMSMFMKIVETDTTPSEWPEKEQQNARCDVLYYNTKDEVYFTKGFDEKGNIEFNQSGGTGYFAPDSMIVDLKTYTNDGVEEEDGTINYLPPDTASHNYYYKNLSSKAQEADTLYGSAIYRWVDDEVDSENSGWKISIPPTMPDIKYATVHLSRLFGVSDDCVYASGFNDYTNWNLDTIDQYNEANSWFSQSQSNTKAGGDFTGITTFDSHVICFKRDFMHEIYNTKNPFRLQDIYAEGTIDNRTIQNVDGKLIFVSEDDVKIYTGSNPRIIGYNLNMPKYTYAVSGTDNRNYYLYCEDNESGNRYLYVYDTYTELWSEQSVTDRVIGFAHNKNGMYMLCSDGNLYKMDTNQYMHKWSFETDLITNQTVDIKHIKKLQMLVDIPEQINGMGNVAEDETNPAYMKVYILYDDEVFDENKSHLVYTSKKRGKFPIRVKPRKTANFGFKLHFEGEGYMKLYELEIFVEAGGDLFV